MTGEADWGRAVEEETGFRFDVVQSVNTLSTWLLDAGNLLWRIPPRRFYLLQLQVCEALRPLKYMKQASVYFNDKPQYRIDRHLPATYICITLTYDYELTNQS